MNSRERTFASLDRREPDRLPIDFWASAGMKRKLEAELGIPFDELLEQHDVDLRYIEGPHYIGPPLAADSDIWGVRRTAVEVRFGDAVEVYQEVGESPLAAADSVAEIHAYAGWPSPDWFDYSGIEAQCDAIRARDRVVVFMGDRLNRVAQLKPAMYLRGMENILADMALREELAAAILGKIRTFYSAYLERILAAANGKIDIVLTGDDFGSQNGLLLSPAMWRRLLQPGFAAYIRIIKAHGARAMHHTCGSIVPILPDLVDSGLDILQSVQPEAAGMSLAALDTEFGDRLCFHGGISIQRTLPYGTPDDIRRDVRQIAGIFKPAGGYIFCTAHNIQADTPVANARALLEAYARFG